MSGMYKNHFLIKNKMNGSFHSANDREKRVFGSGKIPEEDLTTGENSDKEADIKGLDWKRGSFHISEFLVYHDSAFLMVAYRGILKRDPDPVGTQHYLALLEEGASKEAIVGALRYSEEGMRRGVKITGFRPQIVNKYILGPLRRLKRLMKKGEL